MTISPETKKWLLIALAIVGAVIGGVYIYRHEQNTSAADQGASDQALQDELALEEEQAYGGGLSYGASGGESTGVSIPSETTTSLGSEIQQIEQAINPTPAPSASTPSTPAPVAANPPPTTTPVHTQIGVASAPTEPNFPLPPSEKRYPEAPVNLSEGVLVA